MTRTLVLGVGNTLLSDEGCGVHVVRHLQGKLDERKDVQLLDGGTLSFSLAAPIADHEELIVVDAARLDAPPGAFRCFQGEAMDRFLGNRRRSAHEVGLLDLMDMLRLTDCLPRRRALVAIQPASLEWGARPTAMVAAAIPQAARRVLELIDHWRNPDAGRRICA
ncbi:MAG TPA: hydrogenase maturation protease [Thiolapillus brandeum]|uniref:Hydrogenase maturation protease n=1 Tax=Thiolapillus brandeum TaxID=1076588 RepID=A0A7C5IZ66_9GAMM|nr:hydrogenase maturation protease [Thiolapillus brandeum]